MDIQVFTCQHCGQQFERPTVRGNHPKWCPTCKPMQYRHGLTCPGCGKKGVRVRARYCSRECAAPHVRRGKVRQLELPMPPRDPRTPLRRAYEDGDHSTFIRLVRSNCEVADDGCWIWQKRLKDGYAIARMGGRDLAIHRAILEASMGGLRLGSQPAHHICGQAQCVNPEHLQPVTHRENVAEMLARHSYLSRIRELEDALASVAPAHPLLTSVVPVL